VTAKKLATACVSTVTATKAIAKSLAVACISTLTGVASKAHVLILTIAAVTTVTASRTAHKLLSIASVASLTSSRTVAKYFVIPCVLAVTGTASRFVHLVLSIASAISVTGSRSVLKALGVSVVSSVTSARNITKTLFVRCISTVVGTAVSSVTNLSIYARKVIGRATALFVTGIAGGPVTITPAAAIIIEGTPMTTIHDPINFVCGDDWQLTGPLNDALGNPLNLVGAAISWKLDSIDGLTNFLTLGIGNGITVISEPLATIIVDASAAQTAALSAGSYRDWLRVTLASGAVMTEWSGVIIAGANPA
jgi:hypothetical protein